MPCSQSLDSVGQSLKDGYRIEGSVRLCIFYLTSMGFTTYLIVALFHMPPRTLGWIAFARALATPAILIATASLCSASSLAAAEMGALFVWQTEKGRLVEENPTICFVHSESVWIVSLKASIEYMPLWQGILQGLCKKKIGC